jgi:hypothetical protein
VSEAEISIDYQSEEETAPQVSGAGLGAQATIAVQNDTPGSITLRLKSSKPLSGSVLLAMAQIRGSVTFMTAWLKDERGMTVTPRISIKNPTDEELKAMAGQRQTKTAPAPTRPAVTAQVYGTPAPASGASSVSSGANASIIKAIDVDYTSRTLTFSRHRSVLDAFRSYSGVSTPAALARLFERNDAMFRQEPRLLLSDGSTALRLTVRTSDRNERAPQFFISGGTCTALEVADDQAWELEIVPDRGSMTATVTVLTGSEMIEFPLAVAPPLELFDEARAGPGEAEYVRVANEVNAIKYGSSRTTEQQSNRATEKSNSYINYRHNQKGE